uniref:Uncharacterized protein n=1 Tax=Panagrolaimus sp. ES5 TaxID=591445 RepID=A0AC34G6A9_9BILA
ARGTSLLKSGTIPTSEQIIYKQCLKFANTPVKLAKCVTQLLNIKDNFNSYQQKDSLSALEKLGELFFGSKFQTPKTNFMEEDFEEPLKRVIPTPLNNQQFEVQPPQKMPKYEIQKMKNQNPAIAVKERYYANYDNGKMPNNFHPIVRSKVFRLPPQQQRRNPVVRAQNGRRYYRTDARTSNQKPDDFQNLSNLEKITRYYKMLSHCERYFKKANQDNSNFVSSASKLSYKFEIRKDETMSAIENVFEALESVVKFNFDNKSENEWIETLLEISGASKTLDDLVIKMAPEMKAMNERVFPTVLELERMDQNWEMVVNSYSEEQKADIRDRGYAFLEPDQLQLVYSGRGRVKMEI